MRSNTLMPTWNPYLEPYLPLTRPIKRRDNQPEAGDRRPCDKHRKRRRAFRRPYFRTHYLTPSGHWLLGGFADLILPCI
jgi:hypothetical protein